MHEKSPLPRPHFSRGGFFTESCSRSHCLDTYWFISEGVKTCSRERTLQTGAQTEIIVWVGGCRENYVGLSSVSPQNQTLFVGMRLVRLGHY